ncbi:helix-turn-helix domain-containing protein [Micromonospora sp. NPDC048170]|uniref:helix-turn-helix domain-containing protein n=1 Tax=Micromonospora sp. NPDC048170 TaxID=3154819 RepID=UPI0034084258
MSRDDTNPMAVLGLAPAEQAVYEFLVDRPSATPEELAEAWRGAERIAYVLAALERRGLVSVVPDGPLRYAAVAPSVAFQSLLLDQEGQLNAARRHLSVLDAAYQDRPRERGAAVVELVTGEAAVRSRLAQIHRVARREVCRLDKPPYPGGEDAATGAADLLRRGLTCRTIYDRSFLDHPGSLTVVEDLIRAGQQARVLTQVPVCLYLVDDRLAVVPVPGRPAGQGDAVIIVRPSALLDALIKLFDGLWQRALPLPSPTNPQPLEHRSFAATGHQRLVTLLLSGLTDEAIARQLGLSHRTVQRRIAALMADLGAHTRFQAGAQAALRGFRGAR